MAPVAQLPATDCTTPTAALKSLSRHGPLRVEADSADQRSHRLGLTEAGHAALLAARPIWKQTHSDLEARLPGLNVEGLRTSLRALA